MRAPPTLNYLLSKTNDYEKDYDGYVSGLDADSMW